MNIRIYFLFLILVFNPNYTLRSQNLSENYDSLIHTNHTFVNNIKTIQLHKNGWELSYPILELNSSEKLLLSFDDLADEVGDYYYTFIHCDAGWNTSDLIETDFLEGFPENQITNYKYSFNTTVKYIHYKLEFPNDDIQFRNSGNYILLVYKSFNKEEPLFTRRFLVYENLVDVRASIIRPTITKFRDTGQEIEISVKHLRYDILDPYSDIKVVVSQNGRWDNAVKFDKPSFVRNREIVYDFDRKNIFYGGSEYRYFDIKSIRYQTEYIRTIDFMHPNYHIGLYPSKSKASLSYFFDQDLNGKYYIRIQEGVNNDTEADYVKVYFTLTMDYPLGTSDIYVFGALSDWACKADNHMIYNFDTRAYEGSLLLKQGYYNYEYIVKEKGKVVANNTLIEGSHFETENDYLVFVYYQGSGTRYDRLIGTVMVNTLSNPR